jgi:hypothetical protein
MLRQFFVEDSAVGVAAVVPGVVLFTTTSTTASKLNRE